MFDSCDLHEQFEHKHRYYVRAWLLDNGYNAQCVAATLHDECLFVSYDVHPKVKSYKNEIHLALQSWTCQALFHCIKITLLLLC